MHPVLFVLCTTLIGALVNHPLVGLAVGVVIVALTTHGHLI